MKKMLMAVGLGLMVCGFGGAQAPAGAPAGATGICKDGSYWTGTTKSGACRGHKGIQTWYADAAAGAPAMTKAAPATAAKAAPAATPVAAKTASGAAPAGATGVCKDGSYWTGTTKSGACRGHQGIQTWYADAGGAPATKSAAMPAPAAAPAPARAMPAPTPAAAPAPSMPAPTAASSASAKKGPAAAAAAKTAAPGGAPGMVWVNTDSNVYHCYGDTYYGKTKAGAYMSEADAKAKGARGARGATCSK